MIVFVLSAVICGLPARSQSAPEVLVPGIRIQPRTEIEPGALRMEFDPSCDCLLFLHADGRVYRETAAGPELLYSKEHHGLGTRVWGMTVGPDGSLYLVGNDADGDFTTGIIVRGLPGAERVWQTVARTEPYPRSGTAFDHALNAIVVSPEGEYLFVNSGSRTDHGEVQDAAGRFPGLREVPLSSAIFRIPLDSQDLLLPNDDSALRDYLFADGFRNSFDLAFSAEGHLFATENSGDRDDDEELNWIRQGKHYGFPWRMGGNENPQQRPDYDPTADLLLNPESFAVRRGFYVNDPDFPPPSAVFTPPIVNHGPDAAFFRDPADGSIHAAESLATFTAHRSPLGLVFDVQKAMPHEYAGDGFVLSYTTPQSRLLGPFGDEGGDLLHLTLDPGPDSYTLSARRIVKGLQNPIDAVIEGNTIYVLEFGQGARVWEVQFDEDERSLFDGRTFDGWEGNLASFRIEDGAIVAGTLEAPIPRNEFLCTVDDFEDFELRLEFRLLGGPAANAGVQFRTQRIPDHHEVIGYQADMGDGWWGALYDESRRNRVLKAPDFAKVDSVLKRDDWNEYVIRAEGSRIRLAINGLETIDYTEPDKSIPQSGKICVQIHSGPPSEAWYRNIEVVE